MNRRVEFSLNMDNPQEAALYDLLANLLRHRRAGEVIRQALTAYLFAEVRPSVAHLPRRANESISSAAVDAVDEQVTSRIVSQSAEMFGF